MLCKAKLARQGQDLKLMSDYTYVRGIIFFPALIIHLKEKNRRREKRRKRELNFKALINFKTLMSHTSQPGNFAFSLQFDHLKSAKG